MATLKATKRTESGTNAVRRLRKEGLLPAVIYGHKKEPISVTVNYKEFIAIIRHHERLIQMEIEGDVQDVFIKDAQYDVLGDNILHADFEWVDLDELVKVGVEIKLRGTPVGLSVGGALRVRAEDIEIEVPVKNIPESVMVDVSGLGIGDKLTYGDIPLPEGGKIIGDPTKTFASVEVPVEMPDEEEAPVAEEAPAEETPSEE